MARLRQTPELFIFELDDSEEFNHRRRMLDEGVNLFTTSQFALVGRVEIKKKNFTFDQARKFLESHFFVDVSDEQEELLGKENEVQLQFESNEKFYLYDDYNVKFTTQPLQLQDDKGEVRELLLVKAVPLTPGTHKNFTFTREVLDEAVSEWLEATIVIGHEWDSPGDAVGSVLFSDKVGDELEVTFLLTKQIAIEGVKSGHFHSVSSNVLVRANEELLVSKLTKVDELSLTPTPADEDSIVKEFQSIELPLTVQGDIKPEELTLAAIPLTGTNTIINTDNTTTTLDIPAILKVASQAHSTQIPPALGVSKNKEKVTMEEENAPTPPAQETSESLKLEDRLNALELDNKQLKTEVTGLKDENTDLKESAVEFQKYRKVLSAEKLVSNWFDENKLTAAQTEKAKEMLVKYSKEFEKDFGEFIALQEIETQRVGLSRGFTDSGEVPYDDMSDSQIKLMLQAQADDMDDLYVVDQDSFGEDASLEDLI